MEISIFALEKLIAQNQEKIANCKKQLKDLEYGKIELSTLKIASIENTLEESTNNLDNYLKIYNDIPKKEKEKQKELVRVQDALAKQSYYKLQKIRLKRNKNLSRNQRLEAMMILDELPNDVDFDDNELLEISQIIVKNNIREVCELEKDLLEIKTEFNNKIDSLKDNKDLKHFSFLDTYIPIIILHFSTLKQNIEAEIRYFNKNLEDENPNSENIEKKSFNGFPKYEDWWIEELFKNHQAYFALFKYKEIIDNQCLTKQQKIIWDKIFNNWLMIKKILNTKEENAYDYNFIFDNLIQKYVGMEEELDIKNIKSMEKIIYNITQKEDFCKTKNEHVINTTYLQWKNKKLNS